MERIKWYIKQLFPLAYRTSYTMDGKRHFATWNMWMGRCYNINDSEIA